MLNSISVSWWKDNRDLISISMVESAITAQLCGGISLKNREAVRRLMTKNCTGNHSRSLDRLRRPVSNQTTRPI